MLTLMNRKRSAMACLLGSAVFAGAIGTAEYAVADLNIVGSTHGQNYQGVAQPVTVNPPPGAAAAVPLALCDPGGPLPSRYQNAAGLLDLVDPTVVMPANTSIVWVCTVNGVPNFVFRYTGGFSLRAYNAIKEPLASNGSRFNSIVPGGTGCTAVAGNPQTDPGTGRQYNSFTGCTQLELVNANFATSDTRGTGFSTSMCDQTGACAQPVADTGVQSFPITATPFVMIVGNGVQKCNPANNNAAAGKITLTRSEVEAIYSGQVTSWNQLGYCVFPAADTNADGFPDLDPPGTPFNPAIDQSIVTCSRPVSAGTRIIFNATQMTNAPEINFGTIGGGSPYVPYTGDSNYLAPTVADGLICVQGRPTPAPAIPPNRNAITYNRADEAGNSADFGAGNVGRMNGGYPVPLDGSVASNYVKPANIIHPTDAERAVAQKDLRCGKYTFWADWVGIQRTSPVDPNQALWNQYVAKIAELMPDTPAGFFWARNLRQPGQPVNSEMFVQKAATKGPTQWNTGFHQACR